MIVHLLALRLCIPRVNEVDCVLGLIRTSRKRQRTCTAVRATL